MVHPQRLKELQKLLDRLGLDLEPLDAIAPKAPHQKIDWQILDQALLHPTFSTTYNNDQLEFLGDSVLRLAVSMFLREHYASSSVGELAALRSHLVSDQTLAAIADSYDLDRFLVMGAAALKDKQNSQKAKQSRLADAFEALLAALYLSTGNLSLIHPWLDPQLQQLATKLRADPALGNYKAALQELTQTHWKILPEYRSSPNSSDNPVSDRRQPSFSAEVWLQGKCWGTGQGHSIKAAQQSAAAIAFQALSTNLNHVQALGEIPPESLSAQVESQNS